MVCMLIISDKTKKAGIQEIGDIVAVYDFQPSPVEFELFTVQNIDKLTQKDIIDQFQEEIKVTKRYPKFPHTIKNLTLTDKNILKDNVSSKLVKMDVVKKIETKLPIGII